MGVRNDYRVNGAAGLIAALEQGAAEAQALVTVAVNGSAAELKAATQQNASGRPGPKRESDDYVDSWQTGPVEDNEHPGDVARAVFSDAPQAHRLEWGFVGTDAAGHHVDAPPFPHHGPAGDAIEPVFEAAMQAAAERAVRW